MKNIMKAQLLQLRKDKIIRFIFIGILIVSVMMVWMLVDSIPESKTLTGGEEAISGLKMFQLLAQFFLFLLFCGQFLCSVHSVDFFVHLEQFIHSLISQQFLE